MMSIHALRIRNLFVVALVAGTAARAAPPSSLTCLQEFRSVDDRADADVQKIDGVITQLEENVGGEVRLGGGNEAQPDLRARLASAKARRVEILKQWHIDLDVLRARCDPIPP